MTLTELLIHAPASRPEPAPPDSLRSIDERIDQFAQRHDGLFTDAAAARLGISPKAVRVRRDKGLLVRVHPRVYRCAGAPVTVKQQLRAAVWTSGRPDTFVSHRSAAAMWGIDLPGDPVIEVSMLRPHAPQLDGVVLHRSLDLCDQHVTDLDGLPVTTVVRTLVDLGAVLPWWLVERALEVANSRRLVTIGEVQAMREELSVQGRNGVGVIGAVLERRGLGDTDSQSVLESMFANLRRDYGIDGLVYQHPVEIDGRLRIIDFAVPGLKIAFELKGYDTHSRWASFTDDCVRGVELTLRGWTVYEFTWDDLVHRPGYVARVIREAIRLASIERRPDGAP
jgi:very-short-patch-repair endonuclease